MVQSFGARLRQQRERQQIALPFIADQTKISLSLLEGLERDDMSHWPAGIFRRSFLRAYSQHIGLEPETVVREFLELYPDPAEVIPAPTIMEGEAASRRPPTRLGCLVASAMRSFSRSSPSIVPDREIPKWEATAAVSAGEAVAATIDSTHDSTISDQQAVMAGQEPAPPVPELADPLPEPDLSAVAHLCTEFGRVLEVTEVPAILESAVGILDAIGLIVWVWDPGAAALKPALAHGYSNELLAKLPRVRRDMDNATAASFRSGQTRIVNSGDLATGAVVVPLLTSSVCVGVLAIELRPGGEQKQSVRALATILAAQLATFVGSVPLAEAVSA